MSKMTEKEKMEKERRKIRKIQNKISDTIPTSVFISDEEESCWNAVPIGVTADVDENIIPVYWYLNDQNRCERAFDTIPSTSFLICGTNGSGKTVTEMCVLSHFNRYSNMFQVIGIDCKRYEFAGIKDKFTVVLSEPRSAGEAVTEVQNLMMTRFKLMETYAVNNIYKVEAKHIDVPYYVLMGKSYQFDEFLPAKIDLNKDDREYAKFLELYPDGKKPYTTTIENIYKKLANNDLSCVYINDNKITAKDIKVTNGTYQVKATVIMIDEMTELMCSSDYKAVDMIKSGLGSIARLGRAVGIHLVLSCQRASGSTISTDLKNNIQMLCQLGGFDSGSSTLMFERDISDRARPNIKGRSFIGNGRNIIETQIYSGEVKRFG